jgi:hypothetical protein
MSRVPSWTQLYNLWEVTEHRWKQSKSPGLPESLCPVGSGNSASISVPGLDAGVKTEELASLQRALPGPGNKGGRVRWRETREEGTETPATAKLLFALFLARYEAESASPRREGRVRNKQS